MGAEATAQGHQLAVKLGGRNSGGERMNDDHKIKAWSQSVCSCMNEGS